MQRQAGGAQHHGGHHHRRARHPGGAEAAQHRGQQDHHVLRRAELDPVVLRGEHRRHRREDRPAAIHLDARAQRHRERGVILVHSQVVGDAAQRHRQRGEAGRTGEGHLHARRRAAEELQRVQPVRQQQATVDEHDVQRAGDVDRNHEVAQRQQLFEPVGPHQGADQAEGADRGHLQHEAGDLDHRLAALAHDLAQRLRAVAQLDQGEAEQPGEEDHLQDPPLGQRRERVGGHDIQHHLHRRGHLARHVILGRQQVHAVAQADHRGHREGHADRQHRGCRKPAEGAAAQLGHPVLPVQGRDRVEHGEEHQRHRDHADQVDVQRAQRLQPGPGRRAHGPAHQRAQHEACGHALPERDTEPPGEHCSPSSTDRTIHSNPARRPLVSPG